MVGASWGGYEKMRIFVLGAGVVGTTSAWFLAKAGHEVTVVDRQAGAGLETSFANGSQISVSHALPWANPSAPLKILRWLLKEDAPLLFRMRLDPFQWQWCLKFLLECMPQRTAANIKQIVNLGLHSRAVLQELRRETGIQYDHLEKGILHFYADRTGFDAAQEPARIMREQGCDLRMLAPDEVIAIEPALRHARDRIVGGCMAPADESGDAYKFTSGLAQLAARQGVRFQYAATATRVVVAGDSITGIVVRDRAGNSRLLSADAYLVALGSFSPRLLRPLGINLMVYPGKGYSVTFPIEFPDLAYSVSLTDEMHKLVFARLGNRLRIAGTAEIGSNDTQINEVRCEAVVRRTLELFPGIARPEKAEFWAGLRPSTPSNVPYIGKTKFRNLYLNTGHGTLGWTHACGSAHAIAEIVSGRSPGIDFAFTGVNC
jgi:D-amino-acid dehydrogenase